MRLLIAAFADNEDREYEAVVIDFDPALELKIANYRRAVVDLEDEFPEMVQIELTCLPILLPQLEDGVWLDAPDAAAPFEQLLKEAEMEEPPLQEALYSAVLVSRHGCYFTFTVDSKRYGAGYYETQYISYSVLEGLKHAEPLPERS